MNGSRKYLKKNFMRSRFDFLHHVQSLRRLESSKASVYSSIFIRRDVTSDKSRLNYWIFKIYVYARLYAPLNHIQRSFVVLFLWRHRVTYFIWYTGDANSAYFVAKTYHPFFIYTIASLPSRQRSFTRCVLRYKKKARKEPIYSVVPLIRRQVL